MGESSLQLAQPVEPGQASPHATITLQDALDRAEKNNAQYSLAVTDAKMAKEDHLQARAAGLPSLGLQTAALLTQGNGVIPGGGSSPMMVSTFTASGAWYTRSSR
jgi:outer membrane protein TolC